MAARSSSFISETDGRPDECRYFSVLDEVAPADPEEWGFWLDPAQGMIGWPTFQTKDGKLYGRVWAPGESRIAPRQIEETRQYLDRVEHRRMQAMLYGAPSGGTASRTADRIHPGQRDRGRGPGLGRDRRRHRHQPGGAAAAGRTSDALTEQGMDATAQASANVLACSAEVCRCCWRISGSCSVLLVVGILIYMAVTPFHERELMRQGNTAAATVLGGALVALAIPLSALLATTGGLLDILVWGVVAVILQLVTVMVVSLLMRGMRRMIEAGQVAAAIPLVAAQISIGLLNAAAMVPV